MASSDSANLSSKTFCRFGPLASWQIAIHIKLWTESPVRVQAFIAITDTDYYCYWIVSRDR